jgi:p25-alpha
MQEIAVVAVSLQGQVQEIAVVAVSLQGQVQEIDGPKFVKLCKDTGLIDRRFTVTDADIVFAMVNSHLCADHCL